MAGKFSFSPEDYQQAAIKYRKDLLMLPVAGIEDTTKFMTLRPGIRYAERVGSMSGSAQFAPYDPTRENDFDLKLTFREIQTFFGSVIANFEPNTAISTLLGTGATKGDGQMQTPTARAVLMLIAQSLSENLDASVWKAKRNPSGNTTMDLFNGFDTITQEEIEATNISEANGNYIKIGEEITAANAVDVAKTILYAMDDYLRKETCYLYCTQDFLDKYNEGYKLVTGAIPYNTQFNHTAVEGSNNKLIFCPLANKTESDFIHVSPKKNMLIGIDQMGDVESVNVKEFKPFVLSYIATMFFGAQFESIDRRRLLVADLRAS